VLRTINSYIEEAGPGDPEITRPGTGFSKDKRFHKLLLLSIAGHIIFYAIIVQLDVWANWEYSARGGGRYEIVTMLDSSSPREALPDLRRAPDPIERAEVNRLEFDPEFADDRNLVSRSTKQSVAHGSDLKLPYAVRPATRGSAARGDGEGTEPATTRAEPPLTQAISPSSAPKPESPYAANVAVSQIPSNVQPPKPGGSTGSSQTATQGSPQGKGSDSSALGLQNIRAQYMAYVRAKISMVNEKIMPRTWIAEVLSRKVSADFEVQLTRTGRLLTTRKVRSTGYPRLDDVANDAIYMASPFEGFPPDAGDAITLTVTVYYTPWR
jgi:hypothetical protein